jgi:DNA-binding protein H-NS
MNENNLESMSIDELWEMYEEIGSVLAKRIKSKINRLETLSEALERAPHLQPAQASTRRSYPKVQPKFQNPERPFETWAGRGRQPHWVTELLQAGKNLDDCRINDARQSVPA